MSSQEDAYWFRQIVQTIRRLEDLLQYAGVQGEAIILHNRGDTLKLSDAMSHGASADGLAIAGKSGTTKTSINGIQFIDRFDV